MIHRKAVYLIEILLLMIFPFTTVFANSAGGYPHNLTNQNQTLEKVVTFPDLGYTKDEMYKGVLASRDYSIRWPDAWEVQPGNTVKLVYSHSPILHPRSTMIVDLNGIRLASVLLTEQNTDRAVLEIAIPEKLIVPGFNRLHVEFYMGLDDDFCKDEDNPALWATVHVDSSLKFAYSPAKPSLDLGKYPIPLVDNSQLVDNTVTFILPNDPTPIELNAAVVISTGLGKLAAWHMVTINSISPDAALPSGDIVVIGRPDRMPLLASSSLPYIAKSGNDLTLRDASGNSLPDMAGLLWEDISKADPGAVVLYVTGNTDDAVLTAARALASSTTITRLSGQDGIVLSVPEPIQTGMSQRRSFTFQDLGYPDMQARGTREQNIIYTLTLEQAWQNESEVLLDLHFGHSNVLNSRRSSVTIEVNDTPAGSIALTQENASDAHVTFHLPARLFKVGSNTITVSANLRLSDDVERDWDCLASHSLESWIVVYADSLLTLPVEPSSSFASLTDYPSAFTGSTSLSDMAFVIPEKISSAIATSIMRISEGLGNSVEGDHYFPHVILPAEIDAKSSLYPHLFIIGRPSDNAAIGKFNDRLPLPFIAGTDEPQEQKSVARLVTGATSIGYIQVFPGLQNSPNLVITGNNDEGILWAADTLQNFTRYSKLSGDLAILDGPSSLTSSEIKYTRSAAPTLAEPVGVPSPGVNVAGTVLQPTLWMLYAAAGVFLLALLVLIIFALVEIQHRQKERSQYGSHST